MKIPKGKKWMEYRFLDLSGKWTHWKILDDGYYIDVIDGLDLIKALESLVGELGS